MGHSERTPYMAYRGGTQQDTGLNKWSLECGIGHVVASGSWWLRVLISSHVSYNTRVVENHSYEPSSGVHGFSSFSPESCSDHSGLPSSQDPLPTAVLGRRGQHCSLLESCSSWLYEEPSVLDLPSERTVIV